MKIKLSSISETKKFATKLADKLEGGEVILLTGNLGAGKTYFTKLLAQALGVKAEVKSPTYVLFQKYQGKKLDLYHFDLYRLEFSENIDIHEIGLYEAIGDPKGVVVVEWAELLPRGSIEESLQIKFDIVGEESREVELEASGTKYESLLKSLELGSNEDV
ncbi:MAG TPA: tRNA (adenosine(37)-N6)-threonylcarbamoyltransferase complex ATPase subunit type 1 TsaE [bacterium]|nr:tRNA (adenosine(37)-N6)-threonylcarbamoyltransferase complex ATPase subunit type 1 TsaE [bacterium]